MHPSFFTLYFQGLAGELALLPVDEKLRYFYKTTKIHVFDASLAFPFIQAFGAVPAKERTEQVLQVLRYLIVCAHESAPLHPDLLRLLEQTGPSPYQEGTLKKLLDSQFKRETAASMLKGLQGAETRQAAEDELRSILRAKAGHIDAAAYLLRLDEQLDRLPDWLGSFKCPDALNILWVKHLFLHYAKRGLFNEALRVWGEYENELRSPYMLLMAGDMLCMAGDHTKAISVYREAVDKDPALMPIRFKIAELEKGTKPDASLLSSSKTTICLYSSNNAERLERTIRSLAATEIGNSQVRVLLNGCTDDSAARVKALAGLFPEKVLQTRITPVNIGSPAARNWLINLPESRASDYIAFADDDVDLPKDWLLRYLDVMNRDSRVGVVGGKAVHGGGTFNAPGLQYMYRYVGIVGQGLLKLTLPAPPGIRDTGTYSFTRPCLNVLGGLQLLRREMMDEVGGFDIRYSPFQGSDVDHDLMAVLKGWKVMYSGTVTYRHHGYAGISSTMPQSPSAFGNITGNDIKMCYKHGSHAGSLTQLSRQALNLEP